MADTTYYVCKYTPLELFAGLGLPVERLDPAPQSFACADGCLHPNMCGYGKAVVEEVAARGIKRLILVDCCDVCRRIYDVLNQQGGMEFVYLMPLPHRNGAADVALLARELERLLDALGGAFSPDLALKAWRDSAQADDSARREKHIRLTGAHGGALLKDMIRRDSPLPLVDDTCTGQRTLPPPPDDWRMGVYAQALMNQARPCMRMQFRQEEDDPQACGVICHTVKFCDYYGFQYSHLRQRDGTPLLKIETDTTLQSGGQMRTRLDAFYETLGVKRMSVRSGSGEYYAGIDSGSASTDAVILDGQGRIVASAILPTGAGAAAGAEKALMAALDMAHLRREDIRATVSTGYGRGVIDGADGSVTEITCHARGAYHLNPQVNTVIDIGGQDSKVIRLDGKGGVANFAMNDKCAAGTGRFLDMMARTLEMTLDEMSEMGLHWGKEISISSMCTVFAESEVVSLVAENTPREDIIHGLNEAVALKTMSLIRRVNGTGPYMMTGGVARNRGVVQALSRHLGQEIMVSDQAQLCGALGAALFAMNQRL